MSNFPLLLQCFKISYDADASIWVKVLKGDIDQNGRTLPGSDSFTWYDPYSNMD